jgi:hypothetical protein
LKATELSKIVSRSTNRAVDYATPSAVVSLLQEYARKYSLPIFEMLRILSNGKVQSVSFTKDTPHFRFYARADGNGDMTIKMNIGTIAYDVPFNISLIPQFESFQSEG